MLTIASRLNSGPGYAILAASIAVVFFAAADPIPQDPAYHQFADTRTLLGVPNLLDVVSNLGFLIVGLWGLAEVRYSRERLPYIVLFTGLVATAIGSGWYHLEPNNDTLVWDRLPMTIAFAGLTAAIVAEYFSARAAIPFLWGMLVLGAGSVWYWAWGETQAAGDLRPYAVVAILPMLIVPLVLVARGSRSAMTSWYWAMIALYIPAKVFEFFDAQTFASGIVSGHSLKHVFAALSTAMLAVGLRRNRA